MRPKRQPFSRLLPWWYLSLALGFALLAIVHIISGDRPLLIGIRFVLASAFGFLAWWEFSNKSRKKR